MAGYNPYNGGYNGYQNGYGAYNSPVNPYSSAAIMQNNGGYINGNANMGVIPQPNNMAALPYNGGNMGQPNNNVAIPSVNGMMQNQTQTVMQSNPAPIQQQIPTVMQQQNQQMNNTIQMNPIQGISSQSRVVGSKTEAESVPADFMGAPIIMPMLVNGEVSAIFVKQWDINRGQANFAEFYKYQENVNSNIQNDSSNNNNNNVAENTNSNNLPQQSQEIAPISFATVENVQNMQNIMNGMQETINYLQDEITRLKSRKNYERFPSDHQYPTQRWEYPEDDFYEEYEYNEYRPEPSRNRRYEKQYSEQTDGRSSLAVQKEDDFIERFEGREKEETKPILKENEKEEQKQESFDNVTSENLENISSDILPKSNSSVTKKNKTRKQKKDVKFELGNKNEELKPDAEIKAPKDKNEEKEIEVNSDE